MLRALAFATVLLLASDAAAEETVRIAIVDGAAEIALSGDELEVRRLEVGEKYALAPGGRSAVTLKNGVMLLDGAKVTAADGVKYRSRGLVRCGDKMVRGQIEVRPGKKGLVAINVVPLEDYLLAVLGSEMPRSFPVEALKAQAVAARTYAIRQKIQAWGRPYHMGATVLHQVYGGARAEDPRTREAVEATRGEVMVWEMEPIEAYFHSSCGGKTESGSDALGRPLPYLRPASCACHGTPRSVWSESFGVDDFQPLLKGTLTELKVLERTPTGRARRVLLASSSGKRVVSGVELRRVMGYDRLRSLDFTAERDGRKLKLAGKGFGHGAGMCQWGAKSFADQGWDYRRILGHYYAGAEVRRMY
ncbi:MAG: SpoIID/LytB domain-containing protein [Myxococcales bacterium]